MRKYFILVYCVIVYSQIIHCQDNFSKGVIAEQQDNYKLADSLFTEHLNSNPKDVNARFNSANVKLQLGDTCTFCNTMSKISISYKDKEALKLFTNTCGKTDSIYLNDKFELTTDKKPRYMIVSVPIFCDKSHDVYIHDNKRKNVSIVTTPDLFSSYKTNVIANYLLDKDGNKTYLFLADSTPAFPGGDENKELYKNINGDIQQAKKELNLYHVVVHVEYIIDKKGNMKEFKIVGISGDTKNKETKEKLEAYVSSYFKDMPTHIPAKFRNENVDCLKKDWVTFW